MSPFCQSWETFLHPTISPFAPGQRSLLVQQAESLCPFQGAFCDRPSCCDSCCVCLLLWTSSRCSGSSAVGCPACWLWVQEHLLLGASGDRELDVAEQVESKAKVLKKLVNLGIIWLLFCVVAATSHADMLELSAGSWRMACGSCKYTGKARCQPLLKHVVSRGTLSAVS